MFIQDDFNSENRVTIVNSDVEKSLLTLPAETFQLIVTSPPYNIGKEYEKNMDLDEYLSWQTEIIEKLVPLLTSSGSLCWQVGNYVKNGEIFPLDVYFYQIFKQFGLKLRNRIIWHFGHGLHCKKLFLGGMN